MNLVYLSKEERDLFIFLEQLNKFQSKVRLEDIFNLNYEDFTIISKSLKVLVDNYFVKLTDNEIIINNAINVLDLTCNDTKFGYLIISDLINY